MAQVAIAAPLRRGEQEGGEGPVVRLLHTSDWHLGTRFYGRSLLDDQAYVLDQMVNLVRDLNPDVMVVCGDIFHHRRPGDGALALFHETVGRLMDLGTELILVSGPADDFSNLHLNARWVRQQGLHLYQDCTQVLSPISLRGARDNFSINAWCLPYPSSKRLQGEAEHPSLRSRDLVERVVQRLDPNTLNLFVGYAWAQGVGRREELGSLVSSGGQPLEQRLLDFFDYAALGGVHEPLSVGHATIRYSGGLLGTEMDMENLERSITFVELDGKNRVHVDDYPLRPRRAFKKLSGSWEQLLEQGEQQRSDDLLVLRSDEAELTSQQKAQLRQLSSNVVSVETEAVDSPEESIEQAEEFPLAQAFKEFCSDLGLDPLESEAVRLLEEIEGKL